MNRPPPTEPPQVIKLEYALSIGGERVDGTHPNDPITVLTGHAHILPPGLEAQLFGRTVGERFTVIVPAAAGYGEYDPTKRQTVLSSDLPVTNPQVDDRFSAHGEDDTALEARVVAIEGKRVTVELNHLRAGHDLHYNVTIHAVRLAEAGEIEHGHVHGAGGITHKYHETHDQSPTHDH